jgi:type III secretion protein Q
MKPRPLTIRRISNGEAQALSALARNGASVALSNWRGAGQLFLGLTVYADTQPLLGEDACRLDIEWAGASLQADFSSAAIDSWLRIYLGTSTIASIDGAWRQAALNQACQWLIDALNASGRGQAFIRISKAAKPWRPESARHSLMMTLQLQDEQGLVTETLHGLLHTDALGLLLSVGLLPTVAEIECFVDTAELPIYLYFGVGETDLSVNQLRQLQPGDVVFFSRPMMTRDEVLTLRTESTQGPWWGIPARLNYTNLQILQGAKIMTSTDIPNEDALEPGGADPTHFDINEVPIRVSFDLGHTTLTLGKIQSLQAGEVLNLERTVDDYVTIRANGSAVGTGQLVDIDGRLGVTISKLHAPLPRTADQKG